VRTRIYRRGLSGPTDEKMEDKDFGGQRHERHKDRCFTLISVVQTTLVKSLGNSETTCAARSHLG
jgi:hypothetical protein